MMHIYRKDYDENDHTCPSNARATVDNHGRSQGVTQPGGRHHSYHLGLVKIMSNLIGEGDFIYTFFNASLKELWESREVLCFHEIKLDQVNSANLFEDANKNNIALYM